MTNWFYTVLWWSIPLTGGGFVSLKHFYWGGIEYGHHLFVFLIGCFLGCFLGLPVGFVGVILGAAIALVLRFQFAPPIPNEGFHSGFHGPFPAGSPEEAKPPSPSRLDRIVAAIVVLGLFAVVLCGVYVILDVIQVTRQGVEREQFNPSRITASPAPRQDASETSGLKGLANVGEATDSSIDPNGIGSLKTDVRTEVRDALKTSPFRRTWSNTNGKSIDAEFLKLENGNVQIRRTNDGRTFEYPLERLSDVDQQWVKEHVEKSSAASSIPRDMP